MRFASLEGLWLLAFLLPLIIIYLIKAKPQKVKIPSLIFFYDNKKVKKYNAMLRKLLIRALFFLQLFFIVSLAFSASNPIVNVPIDAYALNTVVVMDTSASMNAEYNGVKRIDQGKQELFSKVDGRVSLVLAEEKPVLLQSNISSGRAKAIITNLDAKDTSTRLDSSILFANEILGKQKGHIVVYSDFILDTDDDILAARNLARANDKKVTFIRVGKKQKNIGFIDLNINRGVAEAFFKNFDDKKNIVDLRLKSDAKQETKRIEIDPLSIERTSFKVDKGKTVLSLSDIDQFDTDDRLYIKNPYETKNTILFITNEIDSPLIDALEANPQFEIETAIPPVIPDLTHDLVIVSDINKEMLLPNTFLDIKKYVKKGGKVVIAAQEDTHSFDFQGLTDIDIANLQDKKSEVCITQKNEFSSRLSGEASGCFTSVLRYHEIKVDNGSAVIASAGKEPIFIVEDDLFYYGIIDKYSGFKKQINYPLFWDDVVNYLLGRKDLSNFNFNTGDMVFTGNQSMMLYTTGFTDIDGREAAVNLLDESESDIFRKTDINSTLEAEKGIRKAGLEVNISVYLLMLGLAILLFEIFYIKRRGDI